MRVGRFIFWLGWLLLAGGLGLGLPSAADRQAGLVADSAEAVRGKYAIVVGIDDYQDDSILDLEYCEADAREFASTLTGQCGYPRENVLLLLGAQANLGNILSALKGVSKPGIYPDADTILFYFSGHGAAIAGENYLLPYDGSIQEALVERLNIPLGQVQADLAGGPFQRQVVFIDACRSKLQAGAKQGAAGFTQVELLKQYASGMKVLLGTQPGAVSREDDSLGHGVFTYYLVQGLRGAAADTDGLVTVGGLEAYVSGQMMAYSRQHPGHEQVPVSLGEGSSQILLAVMDVAGIASGGAGQQETAAPVLPTIQEPLIRDADWSKGARKVAEIVHQESNPGTYNGNISYIDAMYISHDGNYIAVETGSIINDVQDAKVIITEAQTWREILVLPHRFTLDENSFSGDDSLLITGTPDNKAIVTEISTGLDIGQVQHNDDIGFMEISSDNKTIITGSHDQTVKVTDILTKSEIAKITHNDYITFIDISPDNKHICSASRDGMVKLTEISSGHQKDVLQFSSVIGFAAFGSNGDCIVAEGDIDAEGDGVLKIIDLTGFQEIYTNRCYSFKPVILSPDSNNLAFVCENTELVVEISTGRELAYAAIDDSFQCAAFSPDGKYLIVGGGNATIGEGVSALILEVSTGMEVARIQHRGEVRSISFSPGGCFVAIECYEIIEGPMSINDITTIRFINTEHWDEVSKIQYDGLTVSAGFSPDGRYYITACNGRNYNSAAVWQP